MIDEPTPPTRQREKPSKTRQKQQMHALQNLGLAATELSDTRLAALDIPDSLREALVDYRHTRSHEGRRRQLQYIGKLMRQADEAPLREAVAESQLGSARETLALHQAERWRDDLIASDDALTRWLDTDKQSDPQQLRSLVRAVRKEAAAAADVPGARHGRPYRELFQLIKSRLAALEGAASTEDAPEDHD